MLPRRLWLPNLPRLSRPVRFVRGRPARAPTAAEAAAPGSADTVNAPRWGRTALAMAACSLATYFLLQAVLRRIQATQPQPRGFSPSPALPILPEPQQHEVPAGWRVIKDSPGEQEMEYDDGHGNRRHIYRRSWGGSFGSKGTEGSDVPPMMMMADPFEELHREFEAMLRPLLAPFGGHGLLPGMLGDGGASPFPGFPGFRAPTSDQFFGGGSGVPDVGGLGPESRGDRHFHDFINGEDGSGRPLPRL